MELLEMFVQRENSAQQDHHTVLLALLALSTTLQGLGVKTNARNAYLGTTVDLSDLSFLQAYVLRGITALVAQQHPLRKTPLKAVVSVLMVAFVW